MNELPCSASARATLRAESHRLAGAGAGDDDLASLISPRRQIAAKQDVLRPSARYRRTLGITFAVLNHGTRP